MQEYGHNDAALPAGNDSLLDSLLAQLVELVFVCDRLGGRCKMADQLQALLTPSSGCSRHLLLAGKQLRCPCSLPGLQSSPPLTALIQQGFQQLHKAGSVT